MLTDFIHPAWGFIGLALILPLAGGRWWRGLLLAPPVLAIFAVLTMSEGTHGMLSYLGMDLVLGRVDKLSVIFGHVFAIQALVGMIYAFHVKDRAHHAAASLYVAGAFGCVFSGDYLSLFIFWELMSVASTFLVWLNRHPASSRAGFRYFLFHTIGGLSAHADQQGLKTWYANFNDRPPLLLVHGETTSLESLRNLLKNELNAPVTIARYGQVLDLAGPGQHR